MPTMGIKHRADSGFRKFWVLSKLSFGGQVRSSEMPYVSYPRTLAATITDDTDTNRNNRKIEVFNKSTKKTNRTNEYILRDLEHKQK